MKKWIAAIGVLSVTLLSGCYSADENQFDEAFKESLAEGEEKTLNVDNGLFLDFNESGMTYYGIDADYDRYETPFEHMETYTDYTLEYNDDEDLLTIVVEDGEYELDVIGSKVFRDEVNDLNLTTTTAFLPE